MMKLAIFVVLIVLYVDVLGRNFQCYPNQTARFTNTIGRVHILRLSRFHDISGTTRYCFGSTECVSIMPTFNASFPGPDSMDDIVVARSGLLYTPQCELNDYNETIFDKWSVRSLGGSTRLTARMPSFLVQTPLEMAYNSSYDTCDVVGMKKRTVGDGMKTRLCKQLQFKDVALGGSEQAYGSFISTLVMVVLVGLANDIY